MIDPHDPEAEDAAADRALDVALGDLEDEDWPEPDLDYPDDQT